jgi:hypothetical protein
VAVGVVVPACTQRISSHRRCVSTAESLQLVQRGVHRCCLKRHGWCFVPACTHNSSSIQALACPLQILLPQCSTVSVLPRLLQCSLFQHAHNSSHDRRWLSNVDSFAAGVTYQCCLKYAPVAVVPAACTITHPHTGIICPCRFTVAWCSSISAASRQWL